VSPADDGRGRSRTLGLVSVSCLGQLWEALAMAEKIAASRVQRLRWRRRHQPRVRTPLSEGLNVERDLFHSTLHLRSIRRHGAFIAKRNGEQEQVR